MSLRAKLLGPLLFGLLTIGCRPCEELDERICTDLGATECQIWRGDLAKAGSASTSPVRYSGKYRWLSNLLMGPNGRACGTQLQQYPQVLAGIRQAVEAQKAADPGSVSMDSQ